MLTRTAKRINAIVRKMCPPPHIAKDDTHYRSGIMGRGWYTTINLVDEGLDVMFFASLAEAEEYLQLHKKLVAERDGETTEQS